MKNPLSKSIIFLVLMTFFCVPAWANTDKLKKLEASFDGYIGISAINTANNMRIQYRADQRFQIQSTFKLMVVGAILKVSMTDNHLLQKKVTYGKQDLVTWSPVTEKHIVEGMTIEELCKAAMMYSDNTAANLLIKQLGGTAVVNNFARSIGDNAFRLEHLEGNLKKSDSSTPEAMEKTLQRLTLGDILAPFQREQLITWMKQNTTGDARIRAGVPKGWVVADKTGSGDYGISNDIAVIWPAEHPPIVVAIYTIQNKKGAQRRNDIIVSATRILLDEFAKADSHVLRLEPL